jgi:hypothetical protein
MVEYKKAQGKRDSFEKEYEQSVRRKLEQIQVRKQADRNKGEIGGKTSRCFGKVSEK